MEFANGNINIIMSVTGLNLWINFQVLKSTYQQLKIHTASQIRQLSNQIQHYQMKMVSKLYAEIQSRDQIIIELKNSQGRLSLVDFNRQEPDKQKEQVSVGCAEQESPDMKSMGERLRQVLDQNREYEAEFAALIEEMKTIKIYVEELKKVKSMKYIEDNLDEDSPAKRLALQEDQLLTKISSLNRLQQIKIPCLLDTIREVTEAEDEPEQSCYGQPQQYDHQFTSLVSNCQIAQSQSFECTNEIHDITNVLFDNNSQQAKQPIKSQCYETFEYSLSVLKNYCGNTEPDRQTYQDFFELPKLDDLVAPTLRLKEIINQRHLVYNDGYTYTGNTVKMTKHELKPMGFGQLYRDGRLVYCGDWRNGLFDGWGRMYFPDTSLIRSYNGKWRQGYASGSGSIFFWNNDKFMGTLLDSEIRGDGTYYRNNLAVHCGYWENNRLVQAEA